MKDGLVNGLIAGFAGVWFWFMILGVGMAYLFLLVGTRAYLVKGVFYSLVIQYGIYAATGLFRMHDIVPLVWQTVASDYIVAVLFGLVAAYVLKRLDNRSEAGRT